MYPHVTQFETHAMHARDDTLLRASRPRRRRTVLARLWLLARAVDPARTRTDPVRSA